MTHLTTSDLRRYVAGYPAYPPRTVALEQRIEIGTGFHGKWYRSQKEHWLGWLLAKECEARSRGLHPSKICANYRWSRLPCSPLMFWVAECAQAHSDFLDRAELSAQKAAKLNSKDGPQHGAMMRKVLPWHSVKTVILNGPPPMGQVEADEISRDCFDRLLERRSEFRMLRRWENSINTAMIKGH